MPPHSQKNLETAEGQPVSVGRDQREAKHRRSSAGIGMGIGMGIGIGIGIATMLVLALPVSSQVEAEPAANVARPLDARSAHADQGRLYGEVVTRKGSRYRGYLIWEGGERFWDQPFDASKKELAKIEQYRGDSKKSFEIFGRKFSIGWGPGRPNRQLSVRFGDLDKVLARSSDEAVLVLRDGTEIEVDGGSDVGEDVVVVDPGLGKIEIDWRRIESIQFLATPAPAPSSAAAAPIGPASNNSLLAGDARLYGRVTTKAGVFAGFIEWDRQEQLASDELDGDVDKDDQNSTEEVSLSIAMGRIRSIEKVGDDSSRVTLYDGRIFELSGTNDVNEENRGIVIEDPRIGRVVVDWDAFESLSFEPKGDNGPAYDQFPVGDRLRGAVKRTSGETLRGEIVYDLDETFDWESLDGSQDGVSYSIPFRLVRRIERLTARSAGGSSGNGKGATRVTLRSGETVDLSSGQDVGDLNAGVLVIPSAGANSDDEVLVEWAEVESIELEGR